jgi:predicted PurR-regulated permease PerM
MSETESSPPDRLLTLLKRLGDLWLTYLKGQVLLAGIVGGLTWVVNAGIGLAWALPLGLLAGLLGTIPSFGPLLAAIPAVIVALIKGSSVIAVQSWVFALIVAGVYVLIQQLSSFVLEPHILGKRLSLPPLVVLFSVIAGAAIGNVIGAYLAVPLVASAREMILFAQEWVGGRER